MAIPRPSQLFALFGCFQLCWPFRAFGKGFHHLQRKISIEGGRFSGWPKRLTGADQSISLPESATRPNHDIVPSHNVAVKREHRSTGGLFSPQYSSLIVHCSLLCSLLNAQCSMLTHRHLLNLYPPGGKRFGLSPLL
jgi:hypothetical protein